MTEDDYRIQMDWVVTAAQIVRRAPIDELLEIVNKADSLEPVLAPTAYRNGGMLHLEQQRQLLQAASLFCTAAIHLLPADEVI